VGGWLRRVHTLAIAIGARGVRVDLKLRSWISHSPALTRLIARTHVRAHAKGLGVFPRVCAWRVL